jgi:hypothetical protein
MRDIGGFKYGLFSGYSAAVGFDPNTGHLTEEEDTSPSFKESYHRQSPFACLDHKHRPLTRPSLLP